MTSYWVLPVVNRQRAHMIKRRAKGLCEVGGCKEVTGDKWRCATHAAEAAARARAARNPESCACGAVSDAGPCAYYKSGNHVMVRASA